MMMSAGYCSADSTYAHAFPVPQTLAYDYKFERDVSFSHFLIFHTSFVDEIAQHGQFQRSTQSVRSDGLRHERVREYGERWGRGENSDLH